MGKSNGSDLSSGNPPVRRAVGSVDELVASNGSDRYVCNRDEVILPKGAYLLLRGWASNCGGNGPAPGIELLLDGTRIGIRYGEPRFDVAQAYGLEAMRDTGFRAVVETADLAYGAHELRVRVREDAPAEFDPIVFTIDDATGSSLLRRSEAGLFEIDIDRFHNAGHSPSREARIQRRFIAVVGGTLRPLANAARATSLFGLIDNFDSGFAQLGLGPEGDRFLFCFPTTDMSFGRHDLTLVATSEDNRLERVANVSFCVVPICCGPAFAEDRPEPAEAIVAWAGSNVRNPATFSRGDVAFVRGWALDPIGLDAAGNVFLEFQDGKTLAMRARQLREDIANARSPRALFCGFVGSIPTSIFEPGDYVARVMVESKDLMRRHRSDATIVFAVRE